MNGLLLSIFLFLFCGFIYLFDGDDGRVGERGGHFSDCLAEEKMVVTIEYVFYNFFFLEQIRIGIGIGIGIRIRVR